MDPKYVYELVFCPWARKYILYWERPRLHIGPQEYGRYSSRAEGQAAILELRDRLQPSRVIEKGEL